MHIKLTIASIGDCTYCADLSVNSYKLNIQVLIHSAIPHLITSYKSEIAIIGGRWHVDNSTRFIHNFGHVSTKVLAIWRLPENESALTVW